MQEINKSLDMNEGLKEYDGEIQVKAAHYDFSNYLNLGRWNSYYHQLEEVLALNPKSVLIVGIGDNIVQTILLQQGIEVMTFDFDEKLHPDIVGNVTNIKNILQGKKFDVVLCCQVLEHLPYENFENILQQFQSAANHVILSLPCGNVVFYWIEVKLPIVKRIKLRICVSKFWKKIKFEGQHYWEIGFKGYSKRKIQKSIEKFFEIKKQFIAKHNHYHLFFVLQS